MFDVLMTGFKDAALKLKGQARLTEENIGPALDTVRRSLLDADVDFKVVKEFLAQVKETALGQLVATRAKSTNLRVSAGDHFIQICHDEIVSFLGEAGSTQIHENQSGPTVVLLVGLQGSGKTTHAAKIAHLMKESHSKRPLLIAADVYRPAAREQLRVLGQRIDVPVFTIDDTQDAVSIAEQGLAYARTEWRDFVIIDTAGRLAIDEDLMQELERIKAVAKPHNILLVIDSMIGQDAVRTASAFDSRLNLTGVVLTKLDGDTRGGAALSVKKVTGKNIVFVGTGEGLDKLETFRPEGMAGRILGMGDVVGLVNDFSKAIDEEQAGQQAMRFMEGKFDFHDFLEMTSTLQKMGPIQEVLAKTPMLSQLNPADLDQVNDKRVVHMRAIVESMTRRERENPDLFQGKHPSARSRVARIARGCGQPESSVKELIERFMQMRDMMNLMMGSMGGGGLMSKIPGLGNLTRMANMARAMKQMGGTGGMGGMGGFPGMPGMPGMPGGGGGLSTSDMAELNRLRKQKKLEKQMKNKKKKK